MADEPQSGSLEQALHSPAFATALQTMLRAEKAQTAIRSTPNIDLTAALCASTASPASSLARACRNGPALSRMEKSALKRSRRWKTN